LNYIDYIIIAFLIAGFILGFKEGFVRKLIGLAGIILGTYLAFNYSKNASKYLLNFFEKDSYLSEIIAGLLIYLLIFAVASVMKRIIHPFDKVNKLVNQLLGAVLGITQMLFYMSFLLMILNIFSFPGKETAKGSVYYNKVKVFIPTVLSYLSKSSPSTKKLLDNYIKGIDSLNATSK